MHAANISSSVRDIFGKISKVLVDLELSIRQTIFIGLELLWKIRELSDQGLVNVCLSELSLIHSPLSDLDGPSYLSVLSDLGNRPLYHSLLNHLASKIKVVLAGLCGKILQHIFIDSPSHLHLLLQCLRQLFLDCLLQVRG